MSRARLNLGYETYEEAWDAGYYEGCLTCVEPPSPIWAVIAGLELLVILAIIL